jgi:hypothetical protein
MLPNNPISTDAIFKQIDAFHLANKSLRTDYSSLLYDHLTDMNKFRLLSDDYKDEKNYTFSNRIYAGLEQYIFEHTDIIEKSKPTNEIDWDLIDDAKDIFKTKIGKILKNEAQSEYLKPMVDFTIDAYENWLMYEQLHPQSAANPWVATNGISLSKGYLFLMSDNEDIVNSYNKKIYTNGKQEDTDTSKFCIITNNGQRKSFAGFPIDNRNRIQGVVFNLLKQKANGSQLALNTKQILEYLRKQKEYEYVTEPNLRLNTLLPLKRSGLIGVSHNGYFYINTTSDLRDSYNYHKTKLDAIQKTLDMYKKRAILDGIVL